MIDKLLNLLLIGQIHWQHVFKITVNHRAAWHQQALRAEVIGDIRERAVAQDALIRKPGANLAPGLVELADSQRVRHHDVVDEISGAGDDRLHQVQAFHIDCANRAALIDINRARHTADNPVRVRVLTAKHRMDFDDLALKIESFQIMGKAHQVSLR